MPQGEQRVHPGLRFGIDDLERPREELSGVRGDKMAYAVYGCRSFLCMRSCGSFSDQAWGRVCMWGEGRATMVLEVNGRAWQDGVRPGFALARARARCGEAMQVFRSCPKREREAQLDLLGVAEELLASYENTSPGCVVMDLRELGLSALHAYRHWAELALQAAARVAMPVQLGIAPTADLAWLAAQCRETAMTSERLPEAACLWLEGDASGPLGQAGVDCLAALADVDVALLKRWGVLSLADLLALDQQEMGERLGEGMHEVFAILRGSKRRLLKLYKPLRLVDREVFLEDPVGQVEPLLFALQRTLSELCANLRESGEACQYVGLTLVDEVDEVWERRWKLAEPTDRPELFRMLLQSYLEKLELTAPIVSYFVRLEVAPHRYAERDLFQPSVRDENSLAVLLTDLRNLLGEDNVGAPLLQDSYRPMRWGDPWGGALNSATGRACCKFGVRAAVESLAAPLSGGGGARSWGRSRSLAEWPCAREGDGFSWAFSFDGGVVE